MRASGSQRETGREPVRARESHRESQLEISYRPYPIFNIIPTLSNIQYHTNLIQYPISTNLIQVNPLLLQEPLHHREPGPLGRQHQGSVAVPFKVSVNMDTKQKTNILSTKKERRRQLTDVKDIIKDKCSENWQLAKTQIERRRARQIAKDKTALTCWQHWYWLRAKEAERQPASDLKKVQECKRGKVGNLKSKSTKLGSCKLTKVRERFLASDLLWKPTSALCFHRPSPGSQGPGFLAKDAKYFLTKEEKRTNTCKQVRICWTLASSPRLQSLEKQLCG